MDHSREIFSSGDPASQPRNRPDLSTRAGCLQEARRLEKLADTYAACLTHQFKSQAPLLREAARNMLRAAEQK